MRLLTLLVAGLLAVAALACSSDDVPDTDSPTGDSPLARTPIGDGDGLGGGVGSPPAATLDDEEDEPGAAGGSTVQVTATESDITIAQTNVKAGKITFEISNDGTTPTDFILIKTPMTAADLPQADGEVDQIALAADIVDTVEAIEPGGVRLLTIELEEGHYVALGDSDGPHQAGLSLDITVSPASA